jgi:hypothetical protein
MNLLKIERFLLNSVRRVLVILNHLFGVMAGLVPAIHVFARKKT